MSAYTILPEGVVGPIRCKDCKKEFPTYSATTKLGGGRSGWDLLAAHVRQAHPELARDLAAGLADFDRQNAVIVAEGRALCAKAGREGGGRGD